MDNKNNILDRLLLGAKSAKPVLKVEDAFELIKNHEVKSLSSFNLKFFTIMSTSILIIAAFVGGMLMMEPGQKTDTVVSEPEKSSKQEIHESRKETTEPLPTTVHSERPTEPQVRQNAGGFAVIDTPILQNSTTISLKLKDTGRTELQAYRKEVKPEKTINKESDTAINSEITCQEDPGYIQLNEAELKKLGIVVKDGIVAFEQMNSSSMMDIRFFIDSRNGIRNVIIYSAARLNNIQLHPQIVSDCDCHLQLLIEPENYKEVESNPENFLPVRVDVPYNPKYYIFWFKRSRGIMKLFPERIRSEVNENPNSYVIQFKKKAYKAIPNPPDVSQATKPEEIYLSTDSQSIVASPALMAKLGIQFTEKELVFKRSGITIKYGKASSYHLMRWNIKEYDNLKKPKLKKLNPYFISPSSYNSNKKLEFTSLIKSNETTGNFLNKKHTLLALRIQHPVAGEYLFWYPLADHLLTELNPADVERVSTFLKNQNHRLLLVYENHPTNYQHLDELLTDTKATSEAVNALSLDSLSLLKLGIQVKSDYISHIFVAEGSTPMRLLYNKNGVMSDIITGKNNHREAEIAGKYLRLVTDDLGQSKRAVAGNVLQEVNALVPVLVNSGKNYNFSDKVNYKWRPNIIFWFEPNEEFLALLPKEKADEIRKNTHSVFHPERTEILSSEKNESCNYVEVCRNKKGIIEEHTIFPNPANTGTNINIEAPAALQLKVKLTAVNGALVRESDYSFDGKGKGKFHFSTKDVPPGIYLLIITSDQGDAIYERLVVIK